jgi:hypothetical protein
MEKVTNDAFLAIIRKAVKPSAAADEAKRQSKNKPIREPDSESDVEGDGESEPDIDVTSEEEEAEDEEELKHDKDARKKLALPKGHKILRRQCDELKALIKEYAGPDLGECKSDTKCLKEYTQDNIRLWDKLYGKNLEEFEQKLQLLRKLLEAMYPSANTQRGAFTTYTGIFKAFYVPEYGERPKGGEHMDIVLKVLHADQSVSLAYKEIKDGRVRARLFKKYTEDYDDVARKIRKMFTIGMEKSDNASIVSLALAIEGSCGARKGEVVSPDIKFYTLQQWKDKQKAKGLVDQTLRIGVQKAGNEVTDDSFLIENEKAYEELIGSHYTIIQVGVLKDATQQINKFLKSKDDIVKRFIKHRVVMKPTIVLSSDEICLAVKRFREIRNITKENFRGVTKESSWLSTAKVRPVMREYFGKAVAQAIAQGWDMGTHYLRKIYANAGYKIYKDRVKILTGYPMDDTAFMSTVLAHAGSINTTLSYKNVEVEFGYPEKSWVIPPLELIRNLLLKFDALEQQIKDKTKTMKEEIQTIALEKPKDPNVADFSVDGKDVTIKKHKRREYDDDADLDKTVKEAFELMKSKGVQPSFKKLKSIGFGPVTVKRFRELNPEFTFEKPKSKQPVVVEPKPIEHDLDEKHVNEPEVVSAALKPPTVSKPLTLASILKRPPTHPLPHGIKVLVPQHGSKNANAGQIRKDKQYYGEDSVLLDPKDCTGTIVKNVQHGPKRFRDECHEIES